MEKYSEFRDEFLKELSNNYQNCKFSFKLVNISVDVSVFFVLSKSSILENNNLWQQISEEIALKYQPKLVSVYEKWNLYIIFITSDVTSKELKNLIENDKFSSRKIVEDSYEIEFNDVEANRLIVKHITNTDLKTIVEETQEVNISEYIPKNNKLWEFLLDEEKLIGDRKAQELFIKKINTL